MSELLNGEKALQAKDAKGVRNEIINKGLEVQDKRQRHASVAWYSSTIKLFGALLDKR